MENQVFARITNSGSVSEEKEVRKLISSITNAVRLNTTSLRKDITLFLTHSKMKMADSHSSRDTVKDGSE